MKTYQIILTGTTDLLLNQDNLTFSEKLAKWRKAPENKGKSVNGDDRSPPWTWIGSLYHDGKQVIMPSDNLMTMLREAGTKVRTGQGKETYKKHTQSGLILNEFGWPLLVDGKPILMKDIEPLIGESDFSVHLETAEKLGFELFVKRAKVGTAKHVKVRPRLSKWSCSGTLTVLDEEVSGLTHEVLEVIFRQGGIQAGLGNWRPSAPQSPGQFGMFVATVEPT